MGSDWAESRHMRDKSKQKRQPAARAFDRRTADSELDIAAAAEIMSSLQPVREFISDRLTAAAEEIFRLFEKTVSQYEEELRRQRGLPENGAQIQVHAVGTWLFTLITAQPARLFSIKPGKSLSQNRWNSLAPLVVYSVYCVELITTVLVGWICTWQEEAVVSKCCDILVLGYSCNKTNKASKDWPQKQGLLKLYIWKWIAITLLWQQSLFNTSVCSAAGRDKDWEERRNWFFFRPHPAAEQTQTGPWPPELKRFQCSNRAFHTFVKGDERRENAGKTPMTDSTLCVISLLFHSFKFQFLILSFPVCCSFFFLYFVVQKNKQTIIILTVSAH